MTDGPRRDELARRLDAVRERIARAAGEVGRDPAAITLVAVTKTRPAADVEHLAALGVTDVAENKHQEAVAKVTAVTAPLRWHFVGQLQTNKAAAVAGYADWVHTVDRPRLVTALARAAADRAQPLRVLLQVSLDPPGEERRGGAAPTEVGDLAARVAEEPSLALRGVMAVAPRDGDPAAAFATLAEISAGLVAAYPGADVVSAGMSGDLEQAVAHGATHVRVGTALLGNRPPADR